MSSINIWRASALAALMIAMDATAADVTVNIKGAVQSASCDVNPNDTSKDVDLGTIVAQQYATAGKTSTPADVEIALTSCTSASTVISSFSGTADETDPALLAINKVEGGGAASNLAVQILDDTSTPVDLGDTLEFPVTENAATVAFKLRYMSTGPVTAGTADSTLYVDFSYQ